jgi:hypothetical protein
MEIAKIDLDQNSIPTQKYKNTRFPTPIKHRPPAEKDSLDKEIISNNNLSKDEEKKLDDKEKSNVKKRNQSFPNGFKSNPKEYNIDLIILKLLSVRKKKIKKLN